MVAHVLRLTMVGGVSAGVACGSAASPPPHTPRGAARDLLLYHHGLAELAAREIALLGDSGNPYRSFHRLQASRRWHEVGAKAVVKRSTDLARPLMREFAACVCILLARAQNTNAIFLSLVRIGRGRWKLPFQHSDRVLEMRNTDFIFVQNNQLLSII